MIASIAKDGVRLLQTGASVLGVRSATEEPRPVERQIAEATVAIGVTR